MADPARRARQWLRTGWRSSTTTCGPRSSGATLRPTRACWRGLAARALVLLEHLRGHFGEAEQLGQTWRWAATDRRAVGGSSCRRPPRAWRSSRTKRPRGRLALWTELIEFGRGARATSGAIARGSLARWGFMLRNIGEPGIEQPRRAAAEALGDRAAASAAGACRSGTSCTGRAQVARGGQGDVDAAEAAWAEALARSCGVRQACTWSRTC